MTSYSNDRIVLTGLAAAPGRVSGPAYRWAAPRATPTAAVQWATAPERLRQAFADAQARLTTALATADATLAPLLEAQRLMLDDPELHDGAFALLQAGVAPDIAVTSVAGDLAAQLEQAGSEYFRERAIDVRAAGKLVVEMLSQETRQPVPRGAVVLADELGPLDTALLAEDGVAALVTVHGGPTCHAAIIARTWGVPAVVGLPAHLLELPADTPLLVDGSTGALIINPTAEDRSRPDVAPIAISLARRVPVLANIGSVAEAERAAAAGAEGIGLLRTEFLFQDRPTPPSEDEQTAEYVAILRHLHGQPVVVRTLDIGADKPAPFLPMPPEPNPQLGVRGVRLCLQEDALFRTQLRALLRAATAGPLKIMLPMVATVDEVRQVRTLLGELAHAMELPIPPLGAMIEIPMAALAVPELAEVCDFFSLGTNDLLQFLLAADRQHAGVGYLHTADHPGAWRLIERVVVDAHAAGVPVSVCGEWGSDPQKLPRLVELGIDAVSVSLGALARVRGYFG